MHPASEKGHMIVSHQEQSCSVQKTSWGCLGCHFVYVVWFYHVRFFFCSWESHRKSPVAVAFSVQLKILCTYPVLWQLYICESEERILKQILYFLQSDIVLVFFPLIVAWKIKVFGNMLVEFFLIFFNKMTQKTNSYISHFVRCWHTTVFVRFCLLPAEGDSWQESHSLVWHRYWINAKLYKNSCVIFSRLSSSDNLPWGGLVHPAKQIYKCSVLHIRQVQGF